MACCPWSMTPCRKRKMIPCFRLREQNVLLSNRTTLIATHVVINLLCIYYNFYNLILTLFTILFKISIKINVSLEKNQLVLRWDYECSLNINSFHNIWDEIMNVHLVLTLFTILFKISINKWAFIISSQRMLVMVDP
jgi:hypothetical protein